MPNGKLWYGIKFDQPYIPQAADYWARLCVEGHVSRVLYERNPEAKR